MPGGREGSVRVSVLDTKPDPNLQDFSYETLSRNLDANLAEIDMDDFRSDDIHHLLAMPSVCGECHVSLPMILILIISSLARDFVRLSTFKHKFKTDK